MYLDRSDAIFSQLNIPCDYHELRFDRVQELPREDGVYLIHDGERVIYVGQASGRGGIRARFIPHHVNKSRGTCVSESGRRISGDGAGWQEGRSQPWWQPATWWVEWVTVESAVKRTALEGVLMDAYLPYANDEVYQDRHPVK